MRGLEDLGATVVPNACFFGQRGMQATTEGDFDLILLLLLDTNNAVAEARAALAHGKPVVAFVDDPDVLNAIRDLGAIAEDDLCSALYRTQWTSR